MDFSNPLVRALAWLEVRYGVPVGHVKVAVGRQPAQRPAPRRRRAGERGRAVVLDQKVEEARCCHGCRLSATLAWRDEKFAAATTARHGW